MPRPAALRFIFLTVALDIVALGIIIPVLPKLVLQFEGGDTVRAAEAYGLFGTAWALMQFVASPVLGALSDRFGRRPVILTSNLGLGLDYVLMALAPSLHWLFVGRVISGITAASIGTASAYIADVTPPDQRAKGYGLLGIAFGLGFVLGPAIGGLLGSVDPRLPFWAAAGLSLLNAAYGTFVLPESLPKDRRAPFHWSRANPLGSLALLHSHADLLGLAGIGFLNHLAHNVLPSTAVLYMSYRYGWNEAQVGLSLAGIGVCSAAVQGGLVGRVVKRLGECRTLVTGLLCGCVGFSVYGLASTGGVFWLGVPIVALWGLAGPSLQSLMTQRVQPTEQGRLQGANSSLMGIAGMVGPGLFTDAFARGIAPSGSWHVPGASFLLAAGLLVLAAVGGLVHARAGWTR
jgi:DHA1 family tetracycline resistance protein-like MFS transporter